MAPPDITVTNPAIQADPPQSAADVISEKVGGLLDNETPAHGVRRFLEKSLTRAKMEDAVNGLLGLAYFTTTKENLAPADAPQLLPNDRSAIYETLSELWLKELNRNLSREWDRVYFWFGASDKLQQHREKCLVKIAEAADAVRPADAQGLPLNVAKQHTVKMLRRCKTLFPSASNRVIDSFISLTLGETEAGMFRSKKDLLREIQQLVTEGNDLKLDMRKAQIIYNDIFLVLKKKQLAKPADATEDTLPDDPHPEDYLTRKINKYRNRIKEKRAFFWFTRRWRRGEHDGSMSKLISEELKRLIHNELWDEILADNPAAISPPGSREQVDAALRAENSILVKLAGEYDRRNDRDGAAAAAPAPETIVTAGAAPEKSVLDKENALFEMSEVVIVDTELGKCDSPERKAAYPTADEMIQAFFSLTAPVQREVLRRSCISTDSNFGQPEENKAGTEAKYFLSKYTILWSILMEYCADPTSSLEHWRLLTPETDGPSDELLNFAGNYRRWSEEDGPVDDAAAVGQPLQHAGNQFAMWAHVEEGAGSLEADYDDGDPKRTHSTNSATSTL
ncbi:MAG: hypothetical protein K0U23_03865 [Gammaproteobacteria bacterium]|nr:hypothetical protein [Gammaproteobacteria bacterium]